MNLPALGISFFAWGVGTLTARGYEATWEQAFAFTSIDLSVELVVNCLFYKYLIPCTVAVNSRQKVVLDLTSRIIGCISGVLATRLACEKTIQWRQAIITQFASIHSGSILAHFLYGDSCALSMKV
jgi:hypothetical protein